MAFLLQKLYAAIVAVIFALRWTGRRRKGDTSSSSSESPLTVRDLQVELEDARAQIDELQRTDSSKDKKIKELEQTAAQRASEEKKKAQELASLKATYSDLQKKFDSAERRGREQGWALNAEREHRLRERETLTREHQATKDALAALLKEKDEAARELAHLHKQHEAATSLLATRAAELRDAQTYMTKTDTVSHADVQRSIENLNSEIFQLAALMTDGAVFARTQDELKTESAAKAYDNATVWVGREMTWQLASSAHDEDPIWVQMALQAAISHFVSQIIALWDVGLTPENNRLLSDIHTELLSKEPQAVSSRWRALTRRHVRQQGQEESVQMVSGTLLGVFQDVLLVSGMQEESCPDWPRIRDKVEALLASAVAAQKTIGEEIASCEFRVICPLPDTPFSQKTMRDVDDCGRRGATAVAEGTPIACCTDLGLEKLEKVKEEKGVKGVVVFKANVVLLRTAEAEDHDVSDDMQVESEPSL